MRHATAMMALGLIASGAAGAETSRPAPDAAPEPTDQPLRVDLGHVDRNLDRMDEEDLKRALANYSETREPTRAERRALARRTGQPTRWGRARG